jgi:hypothetical protein
MTWKTPREKGIKKDEERGKLRSGYLNAKTNAF